MSNFSILKKAVEEAKNGKNIKVSKDFIDEFDANLKKNEIQQNFGKLNLRDELLMTNIWRIQFYASNIKHLKRTFPVRLQRTKNFNLFPDFNF